MAFRGAMTELTFWRGGETGRPANRRGYDAGHR